MKNSNDTIGNRTRDSPACGTVPQPTPPPRAPNRDEYQECFLVGKGGRYVGLTTLPPSCAECLEILGGSTSWGSKGLSRPVVR